MFKSYMKSFNASNSNKQVLEANNNQSGSSVHSTSRERTIQI